MATFMSRLVEAAQSGKMLGDYAVGESVFLNVGGTAKEFLVVNQGIPSVSSLYDSSCDGTWLLMKDVYERRQWHSAAVENYKASTIHAYLNGTFLDLFDAKAKIKTVKIPYVNGTAGSAVASGANGLETKIFYLSGYEVGWTQATNRYFPIDGACLSYFIGAAATDAKRIAYWNGASNLWSLRSPYTGNTGYVWNVTQQGGFNPNLCTGGTLGVRPALIMPYETAFDPETNALLIAG